MMPDLRNELQRCFQGHVCLMGLGNVDYGDDGFGAILSEEIAEHIKSCGEIEGAHSVVNAGTMPERFIHSIIENGFDHLIFLDSVEFGGKAGSVVFLDAEEIVNRFPQISTHKISPGLMAKWIGGNGMTKTWLLGVQPGSVKAGCGLTEEVKSTLEMLEELLCDLWTSKNDIIHNFSHQEYSQTGESMKEVNA
jgi:hydrogenase maturation protease